MRVHIRVPASPSLTLHPTCSIEKVYSKTSRSIMEFHLRYSEYGQLRLSLYNSASFSRHRSHRLRSNMPSLFLELGSRFCYNIRPSLKLTGLPPSTLVALSVYRIDYPKYFWEGRSYGAGKFGFSPSLYVNKGFVPSTASCYSLPAP